MPNVESKKPTRWNQVKAKIVLRFGTVTACARHIGCSDEAIRLSVKGKCPQVARKLKLALGSATEVAP